MKGSAHIATLWGIPVKIHWTFGLMLLYVAITSSRDGFNPFLILLMIGFVLSIFLCVVLHEFGHALMARRFGVKTFDIIMTPIGGIARLERMPEGKGQELWVAIAGPMVNFVIVALIWIGYLVLENVQLPLWSRSFWSIGDKGFSYFILLLIANGYLGAFNLLPAFPMDGGRMLRSLLSLRMTRVKATQIASYTGQVLAVGLFAKGLIQSQPILALIGVFVFYGARQEYKMLQRQSKLNMSNAKDAMDPLVMGLYLGQSLQEAQQFVQMQEDKTFIVWSRPGIPAGYISRERIQQGATAAYTNIIDPWVIPMPVVVGPHAPATQLISLMQQQKLPIVLVGDTNGYLGVVTAEKVDKMFFS